MDLIFARISAGGVVVLVLISPDWAYFRSGATSSESGLSLAETMFASANVAIELDGVSVDAWDAEGWWANVRMSNTEPLVRLNLEGKTKEIMEAKRDEFLSLIRS